MKTSAPREVLGAIARARVNDPNGFVATDGDGTLWSGDIGEDSFHAFVARGHVSAEVHEGMRREARAYGIDDGGAPALLAQRLYDAYLAEKYPEERACELMTWCYGGWTRDELRAFAGEVLRERGLAARLHAEVADVLDGVRALGLEVFLVSASPRIVVEEAARVVGIAAANVVAADPIFAADSVTITADAHRPIPYGPGKVKHLASRTGDRAIVAALGDNLFDVPMLQAAKVAVAVRPKPRLRARATEVPHLVELDPRTPPRS